MKIPLTVLDFLHRAEIAYGDRIGVIDEPDQPATSWGGVTWRRVAEAGPGPAAGLDALGVEFGERVAISQNSARMLVSMFGVPGYGRTIVPINFRLGPDEVAYIVEHSGASVVLIDPELDEMYAGVRAPHRFVLGAESGSLKVLRKAGRWSTPEKLLNAVRNIHDAGASVLTAWICNLPGEEEEDVELSLKGMSDVVDAGIRP